MIGFFAARVNRELRKVRANFARLHVETCTLRAERAWLLNEGKRLNADNQWLRDENAALHKSLAASVEHSRLVSRELLKSLGHPSMRAELQRIAPWN